MATEEKKSIFRMKFGFFPNFHMILQNTVFGGVFCSLACNLSFSTADSRYLLFISQFRSVQRPSFQRESQILNGIPNRKQTEYIKYWWTFSWEPMTKKHIVGRKCWWYYLGIDRRSVTISNAILKSIGVFPLFSFCRSILNSEDRSLTFDHCSRILHTISLVLS